MGKIKSKLIKKTARVLIEKGFGFSEKFEKNKKIMGNDTMPSKKLRNQIAGYLTQLKKQERQKQERLLLTK